MPTPSVRRLSLESLPVAALKPDARSPRIHSGRQIKQIARSITSFGFNVPILIDRDNNVVAGHGRVSAAQSLGWQEVPAIRLDHLSPAQARAFAIADNRLTEISTWDERLLGEVFRDLAVLELDFSLEDTGFSMAEIDLRIEGLSSGAEPSPDPADQISDLVGHEPVSKPGDLWALGESRIICADALDRASYGTLMQDAKADAVFTDPPFNVPIHGHTCGNGAIRHREFAMASGEMTEGQFGFFLTSVLYLLAQHSMKGSIHYICIDWRHLPELLAAGKQTYSRLLSLCVWAKNNPGLGSFYRSGHEMILVFQNGTGPHRNNIELGRYGRNRSNVWQYPGMSSFGRVGEEGNLLAVHPTVKPVALIADAILDCSARKDIVLDPFLGSGSTLIAAHRVGRVCRGIEIDPLYVDVAIRRWQRDTGQQAVLASTGECFDDIALRARPQDE